MGGLDSAEELRSRERDEERTTGSVWVRAGERDGVRLLKSRQ